jgi:hypothetical protein
VDRSRDELVGQLEAHYRSHGWPVERGHDGTLLAGGPGGVTWLGTAVVAADLSSADLEERLLDLAQRRMPHGGELCPLDLVAASECEPRLRALLDRIGLSARPHVSLYSLAT